MQIKSLQRITIYKTESKLKSFIYLYFLNYKYGNTGDLENTEQGYRTKLPIAPLYMSTVIILMCHVKDDGFAGRMESFILFEVKELTWSS